MPGGDRTGPFGLGPLTGRGAGPCASYRAPGFHAYGGRGWGRGRGLRQGYGGAHTPGRMPVEPFVEQGDEEEYLNEQIGLLKGRLEKIEMRLKELREE